jgi:GTP-binding protein
MLLVMSYMKKKLPLVVIFGRTNVGKSTLFNCLIERKKALVSNIAGTTRDSNIGEVSWLGINFTLIDTGGIINFKYLVNKKTKKNTSLKALAKENEIEEKVQRQARDYLTRANLILFLVDAKAGLLPDDRQMALFLKKSLTATSSIILVANKTDGIRERQNLADFNKLSFGEPIPVSAAIGSGTGDLLDIIINKIRPLISKSEKTITTDQAKTHEIKVCIMGKPNVGKSSLINAILSEDRIIVSSIPHTTREPQDTQIEYQSQLINLIDTAGISKKGQKEARKTKIKNTLERYSIAKSLSALNRADIALLIIDINESLTHQDAKLVEEIVGRKKSLIIIANKWDLIKDKNTKSYQEYIYKYLPFIKWVPIQFTSALTGLKVDKILDLVLLVAEQRKISISDNALNKFLKNIVKQHRPVKGKGAKRPHLYELKQTKTNPPEFFISIGAKDSLRFSYIKFIENRLRKKFGFLGTPITIRVNKNKKFFSNNKIIK